jgi:hypothetical protein
MVDVDVACPTLRMHPRADSRADRGHGIQWSRKCRLDMLDSDANPRRRPMSQAGITQCVLLSQAQSTQSRFRLPRRLIVESAKSRACIFDSFHSSDSPIRSADEVPLLVKSFVWPGPLDSPSSSLIKPSTAHRLSSHHTTVRLHPQLNNRFNRPHRLRHRSQHHIGDRPSTLSKRLGTASIKVDIIHHTF